MLTKQPRNFKKMASDVPPQAANIVDSVSIFAVNVLRRYPLARLVCIGYLLVLHFMVMWVMHSTHGELHANRVHRNSALPGPKALLITT